MSAPNSVFRIATKQAIKEIIESPSEKLQYGLILTDENLEDITDRVVDLFEMTLNLRSRTQELFKDLYNGNNEEEARESRVPDKYFKDKTVNLYKEPSNSVYSDENKLDNLRVLKSVKDEKTQSMQTVPKLLLPRKRMMISQDEKKKLLERL